MPSISYILKAFIKIGYIILILLISKATSEFSFSNEIMNPVAHLPDTPPVHEAAEKVPLSIEDPSMRSENKLSVENISNFEKDINDPFVQKITRVSDDDENMIELNNLSRKKKFLWFQIGKDESGEERFRTLHRKKYNSYDFDEHENLYTNQYEDKIINKLGAKVTNVKTEETKLEAPDPKVEESLKHQPDHEEDFKKSSSTADRETPNESPANSDKPAKLEVSDGETLKKPVDDAEKSLVTESQLSQSYTKPKPRKKVVQEDDESFIKMEKKYRGRKIEDSLMLEFAHNRPDSRILWLNYPDYKTTDEYRLIDEAAERTLITSREYGFVNTDTDSMKAAGRLITYVEKNKIGYEVLNFQITSEWNQKSPQTRAAVCKYLVNDNMMLRKYQFIYDSSQPPELIRAHNVTILLQIKELHPRRLGALSCPVIQPNTSLALTLFMSPITYVSEDTDEYVFTFVEVDPIKYPLYVRLMFLSRLASGDSVEDEFVDDEKINEMDELWWYGKLKEKDPKQTAEGGESISKNKN